LYLLTVAINTRFGEELRKFTGGVAHLKNELHDLLNQFLFLHYNREFEIAPNKNYLNSIVESGDLTKMERRIINVIESMTKINKAYTLKLVSALIEEENEDLVLEALNSLILQKVIISPYSSTIKSIKGDSFKKTSVKKN
jgi:hypothetical protein